MSEQPELTLEDLDRYRGSDPHMLAVYALAREALLALLDSARQAAAKPQGETVRVRIKLWSRPECTTGVLTSPDWMLLPRGEWIVTADLPVPVVPEVRASVEVAE